jgi:hypothetical protein
MKIKVEVKRSDEDRRNAKNETGLLAFKYGFI